MKTLQKFSSVHAQVHNHFNQERHLVTRQVYKQRRSAAFGRVARPRRLIAAWVCACCAQRRRPAVALTKPLAIVFFVAGNYAGALLATLRPAPLAPGPAGGGRGLFWLRSLTQPTLVVMGRDDPIVPMTNGRILARLIPNSRLEVIACGHLFIVTMPRETAKLFERFVGEAWRCICPCKTSARPRPFRLRLTISIRPGARERFQARIKIIATTLLAFSVVVAVVAEFLESRYATLGYVAAWAEAAAVGGLADWYAVVALFRHPCGIPSSSYRDHLERHGQSA